MCKCILKWSRVYVGCLNYELKLNLIRKKSIFLTQPTLNYSSIINDKNKLRIRWLSYVLQLSAIY